MLVKFRHGVVKQKKDAVGNPSSIIVDDGVFRLSASKTNVFTFTISHEKFDYLFDIDHENLVWEIESGKWFLFLNVDFLTAKITTGKTQLPVFYTDIEPQNVSNGQHWYDVNDAIMRVYEDGVWKDTLRLFVGQSEGNKLTQLRVGSQFAAEPPIRPIYPLYDNFGYPMRVRRPKDKIGQMTGFQGSISKDLSKSRTLVRLGDFLVGGAASTYLQSFCLVHLMPGKKVKFSDSTDPTNRVIGMVVDGASPNSLVDIKTFGFVKNENWDWSDDQISKPLFSDGAGNVTTIPPDTGVLQQVGFVLSRDHIFLDIKRPIILTVRRQTYSFVPGELKPSVVISFTRDKKFIGSEILIDFETQETQIFSGDGVSVDFETEPVNLFTPDSALTFSYSTSDPNLFTAGADILYGFGIEDLFKFSAGSEIKLLDFEEYGSRTFNGQFGDIADFNTSTSKVFIPDNLRTLVGMSIYDLYKFNSGDGLTEYSFQTSTSNVFVPSSEFIFTWSAQDKNVFIGSHSGKFTFTSVLKNIFGTSPISQRLSFSTTSGVQVFAYGIKRQLFNFSA